MLTLRIKSGEYITIGEDVAVQIFDRPGDSFEVSIKAPREVPIFRSDVFERSESRPDGLKDQRVKPPSEKRRDEKRLRALARREERYAAVREMSTILDKLEKIRDCAELHEMRRLLDRVI